ncbi:MAG: YfhO family protein [Myxococcota bacterium]|nr:YfhO family protein [Myxococcota bacterium]
MARPSSNAWLAWAGLGVVATSFWVLRMLVARPERHFGFGSVDLYGYVHPALRFVREELLAGRVALWNPFQLAGLPTAAMTLPGALYPGNLLLLPFLPAEQALAVSTVLHWTIAGGFTWLFARRIGLDNGPALLAGLVFLLSGRILGGAYQHPMMATQVWLPALCWALHGLLTERGHRWTLALASALALAFLGGFVQAFVYEVQLAALYGAFGLVWVCGPGTRRGAIGRATLGGLLALGLVAPLLLPALEFAGLATRSLGGIDLAEASRNAVAPERLLAGLVGSAGTKHTLPQPYPWLVALPILTLPLALCAPLARHTRAHAAFFAVAAVVSGLFTLGAATPVFRVYHALPFGNLFRFPDRMDFVYVFCAGIVIACGAQGLVDWLGARKGARLAAAVSALLAIVVGGELFARSRLDLAHPLIDPPEWHLPEARAGALRSSGERVFFTTFPKVGTREGIAAVPDYEPNLPRAYAAYFGIDAPIWHGHLDPVANPELVPLLDRMGVRLYVDQTGTRREALRRAVGGSFEPPPFDARRPTVSPRVFVAEGIAVADGSASARVALAAGGLRDAVLEAPLPNLMPPTGGRAWLRKHAPQQVEIETDCPAPCLVVLTDLDYPGWEAAIDGRTTEIHRVNLLFRGVVAPAGSHRLTFTYRPASFRWGLVASAASVAAALGCWGLTRRRARGTRSPDPPAPSRDPAA